MSPILKRYVYFYLRVFISMSDWIWNGTCRFLHVFISHFNSISHFRSSMLHKSRNERKERVRLTSVSFFEKWPQLKHVKINFTLAVNKIWIFDNFCTHFSATQMYSKFFIISLSRHEIIKTIRTKLFLFFFVEKNANGWMASGWMAWRLNGWKHPIWNRCSFVYTIFICFLLKFLMVFYYSKTA